MRFAKWIFLLAGLSGVAMVAPMYLLEARFATPDRPINHPEFFYGFAGVTLAWQVMFLVIATDPRRYRLAMMPAVLEKAGFAVAIPILVASGRIETFWLGPASMDGTLGVLFAIAFVRTAKSPSDAPTP